MYNFNFTLDAEDHQNFSDILNHAVVDILSKMTDDSYTPVQKEWLKKHLNYTRKLIAKINAGVKHIP